MVVTHAIQLVRELRRGMTSRQGGIILYLLFRPASPPYPARLEVSSEDSSGVILMTVDHKTSTRTHVRVRGDCVAPTFV